MRVEPPAHPQIGERQERRERVAVQRGERTDLDEARRPHDAAAAAPAVWGPAGVGGEAMRGLCEPGVADEREEPVEEADGQIDVVVDDEQPVVAVEVLFRQERVDVLELPAVARSRGPHGEVGRRPSAARPAWRPACWRPRVARSRRRVPGGARADRGRACGELEVEQPVAGAQHPPPPPTDLPARAGEEVVDARGRAARASGSAPRRSARARGRPSPAR